MTKINSKKMKFTQFNLIKKSKLLGLILLFSSCDIYFFEDPPLPIFHLINISNKKIENLEILYSNNHYTKMINLLNSNQLYDLNKESNEIIQINYDINKFNQIRDSLILIDEIKQWGSYIIKIKLYDSEEKKFYFQKDYFGGHSGNERFKKLIFINQNSIKIN